MKLIYDIYKMNQYIEKYKIHQLFSEDIKPFMELFLFKSGEYICKDNEEISYIYFFVEGKAKVYITLSNGKSLLLCFYQPFTILGDIELVEKKNASSNIQAIEDVYCIGISLERAREYLLNDSKFLRVICTSLGKKLNRCSNNSSINLLYPLKNRLASYILVAGKPINHKDGRSIEFFGNLTEIAELLGTSYRHLLRTLNELSKMGVLEKKNSAYEVTDLKQLKKLAGDLYR
ncbi:transcriptional regulator YeiL [Defluviitalea raffinosedens]|jgi:CRP-like cAMP-binding protein|uniref:transcriptional regulator YeiL n=1 Tax=Defluviitalea raffinosedens TaxID=1450156 RepID=UPI00176CAC1C|nr:transcriptional regulator YeiL [Defluviitalea raffinosedens]MBM7685727.1 CRP-like cAMP-binding protein [Defluviitalea raffinosedens]MBZ4667483.1 cyclic nucleotide-binding domain protein [Defluviitaleaceae bacterium]HHW66569.1 transcriptional regulator YeiL [Candidatus Epulonipiscium sp.]